MKEIVFALVVQAFAVVVLAQGSYKAAVVEYAPVISTEFGEERILQNTREYIEKIEEASLKEVKIIVFPEVGLTDVIDFNKVTKEGLVTVSTEVPDPAALVSPCENEERFSKSLKDLSCAARTHGIIVVVNLIERQLDNKTNTTYYYNTNVAFDKNGNVIARYRKIKLFNEYLLTPGNQLSTFKTDFGVTFGMFTCFDLLFKNPALDVLADQTITDVILATAWFAELPFYGTLSIQHGYAKANGVNLLAAELSDPANRNGGSGIYLANGDIAEAYISGIRSTKMLIADVPIVRGSRKPAGTCQGSQGVDESTRKWGGFLPTISDYVTVTADLRNYTIKSLDLSLDRPVVDTVCSGDFCCTFNVTYTKKISELMNYVYKLIAYHGISPAGTTTLGLRTCALVACLNNDNGTCGRRHDKAPEGITFENVTINGTIASGVHQQPSSLRYDLKPVSGYSYCTKNVGEQLKFDMSLDQPQETLLTFGVYGRVFSDDGKPAGPKSDAIVWSSNVMVMLIGIAVFLIQE